MDDRPAGERRASDRRAGGAHARGAPVLKRAIVGWVTLAIGAALVATSYRERRVVPSWVPQLAIAVVALGISTLAASRFGVVWSVTSIAFSLVAIVLLLRVIFATLRRRR